MTNKITSLTQIMKDTHQLLDIELCPSDLHKLEELAYQLHLIKEDYKPSK